MAVVTAVTAVTVVPVAIVGRSLVCISRTVRQEKMLLRAAVQPHAIGTFTLAPSAQHPQTTPGYGVEVAVIAHEPPLQLCAVVQLADRDTVAARAAHGHFGHVMRASLHVARGHLPVRVPSHGVEAFVYLFSLLNPQTNSKSQ
jgi:hypothetical protein